jgi:hypothetical protein
MKKLTFVLWLFLFSLPAFSQNWTQRVQVLIQATTPQGQYNDAIYFAPADYAKLVKADIDKQVQVRINNWVAFVVAQSSKPPYIPTKEELKESTTIQAEQLDKLASQFIAAAPAKADIQAVVDKVQVSLDKLKAAASIAKVIVP